MHAKVPILCCVTVFVNVFLFAQDPTTSITGAVMDRSGAVVPNALVKAVSEAGVTKEAVTDNSGTYLLSGLAAGIYHVSIAAQGFKVFSATNVKVEAGQTVRVDAGLELPEAATSVNVAAQNAAGVETESAQLSGTITQKEVVAIGLNGRNFTQLIALAPGVSNQTGQDEAKVGVTGSVKYSVNGGRVEYNTFDVDGSDLLNAGINKAESTLIVYPSLDALQEVKVLTSNYGAMYGRTASGTVLVATKSGTESFHGNGYEFVRNELFNARNFFDQTKGAPLYRRNDFGFTLGGPLYIPKIYNTQKNKTFFFVSEEFRREKTPTDFNQAVPSLAERTGDFSDVCPAPGSSSYPNFLRSKYPDCPTNGPSAAKTGYLTVFPENQIAGFGSVATLERSALGILATGVIPAPNSTTGCNSPIGSCYDTVVSPPTTWREDLFRIDHNFSEKLRASVRYIHDNWDTTVPVPQWGYIQNSFPTIENRFLGPGTSLIARVTQTPTPTFLNDFVFSYTNSHITLADTNGPGATWQRPSVLDTACAPDTLNLQATQCPIGYLFNNGFGGKMPGIVIAGNNQEYGGNGFAVDAGYMPWSHTNPTYTFTDNASKLLGKHNLQFGSQFILFQRNQTNSVIGAATGDVQGILTFSNIASLNTTGNAFADFLYHIGSTTGAIKSFQQDSAQAVYHQRYRIAEPYFQDDWRLSSHLTVNLGVRLSLFGTYHEKNLNAFNWLASAYNPALASQLVVDPFFGELTDTATGNPIPISTTNPDPRTTNGLVQCGKNGLPSGCMQGHLFNPAPRVGFAWDPKGDGRTSIRGGYGIFFEHGTGDEANTGSLEGSAPLVQSMIQDFPSGWPCIGGVGPGCGGAGAYPLSVTSIPTKAVWPYVQQWSLSIQRQLPQEMVATFAYVGSKGTHLTAERQLNQLAPVPTSQNPFRAGQPIVPSTGAFTGDCSGYDGNNFNLLNGSIVSPGQPAFVALQAACSGAPGTFLGEFPNVNALRTFAYGFNQILALQNIANSSYNAFQTTLRRTSGPLTLGISYSYSHSLDDSSDRSDATFVNSFDLRSNHASSNFDQRHLLNASYVYQLPLMRLAQSIWEYQTSDSPGKVTSHRTFVPSNFGRAMLEGWEISGITIFQSGTPFSVINGGGVNGVSVLDNAGVANGAGAGSYPDLVGNPYSTPPAGGNNGRSFGPILANPAAFAAPQGLTFGTAGRNALNNPHRTNFDLALLKHIKIGESDSLELRAESFNIFNHTQFRIYDSNIGNTGNNTVSCYGGIISGYSAAGGDGVNCLKGSAFLHPVDAHRPRTLQFGLKFSF